MEITIRRAVFEDAYEFIGKALSEVRYSMDL
jgi:hypothetical protein